MAVSNIIDPFWDSIVPLKYTGKSVMLVCNNGKIGGTATSTQAVSIESEIVATHLPGLQARFVDSPTKSPDRLSPPDIALPQHLSERVIREATTKQPAAIASLFNITALILPQQSKTQISAFEDEQCEISTITIKDG
ncbi:MAG: hypothetical protein Q9163_005122 [Psora crenata]